MKYVVAVVIMFMPVIARAEYFVCGNAARSQCAGTVGMYNILSSIDPTKVNDPACFNVPEPVVQEQRTLIANVTASHTNGRCHLKVVDGLAVEMDEAEKTAVNQAITNDANEDQEYTNLVQNNDLCNATRQELQTRKAEFLAALRTDIVAISNIATAKAELDDMAVRITNALGKIFDCMRGRAGRPQ